MWLKSLVLLSVLAPWDAAVIVQLARGVIPSYQFMAVPFGVVPVVWGVGYVRRRRANGDDDR